MRDVKEMSEIRYQVRYTTLSYRPFVNSHLSRITFSFSLVFFSICLDVLPPFIVLYKGVADRDKLNELNQNYEMSVSRDLRPTILVQFRIVSIVLYDNNNIRKKTYF